MRINRSITGAVTVLAVAGALGACSHKQITPEVGDYAIVVGGGAHSNQTIHDVVDPGQHIKVPSGDRRYFLPASNRNEVSDPNTPHADRTQVAPGYTKGGTAEGGQPALKPVSLFTYSQIGFVLNPNHAVLEKFYTVLCSKYGWREGVQSSPNCGATNPGSFSGQNGLSSTAGWLAMLRENLAPAIDKAAQTADQKYGPDLWHDGGNWGNYAQDMADALPAALKSLTGSGSYQFFCGYGSTPTHCAPFTVIIKNIVPTDASVITAYQQANRAAYSAQVAQAQAQVAKALYGSEAHYWKGLQDSITQCGQQNVTCNFYVGNPPGTGVPGR